ncbi:MAG: replication-relaxation family protein [Thermomicrobiales bacterium]
MIPPRSPRRSPLVRHPGTRYPLSAIDQGTYLLAVLASLRGATAIQLRRAVFARTSAMPRQARYRATKALRRLFDAGYVRRVPVFCPSARSDQLSLQVMHTLSAAGARAIGFDPHLARSRAPKARSVLTHDFWLIELGVLALEGCPEGLTITHWWNDRVLAARKRTGQLSLPTIPDALLVVRNPVSGKDYLCLLEMDLGTESVTARGSIRADFSRKIEGYLEYLGAGFRRDFEIDAPPIVLIVTDSERRLDSLRTATQRLGGGGRFWFATLDRLQHHGDPDTKQQDSSAGLQGAFWGLNWQTAQNGGLRSLASRCGR